MIRKLTLITLFLFLTAMCPRYEKDYQKEFCTGGIIEYKLDDGSRVDCLTDEYAIELDWGKKWSECAGQALYYSIKTGKKPACALIIKSDEIRYLDRLNVIAKEYDIKVFIIKRCKDD
jgi:hypothetical protein